MKGNIQKQSRNRKPLRKRWMACVKEDLKTLGVTNWRVSAENREEWCRIVQEAKTHIEL